MRRSSMNYLKTRLAATLMMTALLLAYTPVSGEEVIITGLDPCGTQKADLTLWVAKQFNTATKITSGSGFYAYGERGCKYFIADVKMTTYSHSVLYGNQWIPGPMLYGAGPYDLPSSSSFGGTTPTTQEDCNRWTAETKVFTMMHDQTMFSLRGTSKSEGVWSSAKCNLVHKSSTGYFPAEMKPSNSGWDTYRIVTRTKLRSTYQEVAVTFEELPPE
jgi:hypothetical protein